MRIPGDASPFKDNLIVDNWMIEINFLCRYETKRPTCFVCYRKSSSPKGIRRHTTIRCGSRQKSIQHPGINTEIEFVKKVWNIQKQSA